MKTRFQLIAVILSLLVFQAALPGKDTKGRDTKTKAAQNKETPKVADQAQNAASPEESKAKDPLENMKFRNLGPAVGGGRVTAVAGVPGKPNIY
ncbi:MAG TPA: hypothetical protein VFI72_09795, partial [Candidatus Angelobacter sp.]|nr:hypothetical protein [Candidatus Angelobacter sp.]